MLAAILSLLLSAIPPAADLNRQLADALAGVDATVGIAFISDSDTITANNDDLYPMMSVFKLHQSIAVANAAPLDSIISVKQSDLDHQTWSPMLAIYTDSVFSISMRRLINHALVESDNNASNILFDRIISPAATDRYVKTIAPDASFNIRYSEADMKRDNALSRENHSSPLSAARLLRAVFTDSTLLSVAALDTIRKDLATVTTGTDRIAAAINPADGTLFAHKTGSGYRDSRGRLIAYNDVAYIRLPDGRDYSLAIMIRDFVGSDAQAAQLIASLARLILSHPAVN